jgi:hypothetical protein
LEWWRMRRSFEGAVMAKKFVLNIECVSWSLKELDVGY